MFIMNKDRTVIIKPTTIWIGESHLEKMVNILASDGNKNYVLGTYDIEYANEEFSKIFDSIYSRLEDTYKMASDEDVDSYYKIKNKSLDFTSIDDDDIPF